MFNGAKIYVAGHTGLLGSAMLRALSATGHSNLLTYTHAELDLTDTVAVLDMFSSQQPDYVILAAAKVGGILGNKNYPADYLHINLAIQDNASEAAQAFESRHVVFLGSSCAYPMQAPQPIHEDYLLTGHIEETSIGYAVAKLAGLLACKAYNRQHNTNRFIALIPNSMYGPHDNFDLADSHVLSALIRRFHEAKVANSPTVTLWGSGFPQREFLHVDDVANAILFALNNAGKLENRHYNIGCGVDYSIKDLAEHIAVITGYDGNVEWDTSKPDGTQRKLLDCTDFMKLGWQPRKDFREGLLETYAWYREHCCG